MNDTPTTTRRVINFAVERYVDTIQNLCDDPSWLEHPDTSAESAVAYIDDLRALGKDLGVDFDNAVRVSASEFERDRWIALEKRLREQAGG